MKQQPHQKFTEHQCRNIMKQLANALCYLHGKNIAHRDIKLENIIIDGEMGLKLIDFGFSTCIEKGTKVSMLLGRSKFSVERPAIWPHRLCKNKSIGARQPIFGPWGS